jgi:hypothetical protein
VGSNPTLFAKEVFIMIDNKEKIKWFITMGFIITSFIIVVALMIVYHYDGEMKMPFIIDKILIVSSADGKNKSDNDMKWNIDINQYSDIYIKISKNTKVDKTEFLKSVRIENMTVENSDNNQVKFYMPNSSNADSLFVYDDMYLFDKNLTYQAGAVDDPKTLKIGNQGGTIVFRTAKMNIANYSADSKGSINYNGLLLKNVNISSESLKYKIKFDLIIETSSATYKTTLSYELPIGKIEDEGISKFYAEDFDKIIFKRVKS